MKTIKGAAFLLTMFVAGLHMGLAASNPTPEERIVSFLWSVPGSTKETTELLYSVVEDSYATRITFKRDKTFKRSDGIGGLWSFEEGKLILTVVDAAAGLVVKLEPPKPDAQELKGIVTSKGKWRGRHIILKALPK